MWCLRWCYPRICTRLRTHLIIVVNSVSCKIENNSYACVIKCWCEPLVIPELFLAGRGLCTYSELDSEPPDLRGTWQMEKSRFALDSPLTELWAAQATVMQKVRLIDCTKTEIWSYSVSGCLEHHQKGLTLYAKHGRTVALRLGNYSKVKSKISAGEPKIAIARLSDAPSLESIAMWTSRSSTVWTSSSSFG